MKRLAQFMKMQRVALIAQIIGRKVGLSEEELEDLNVPLKFINLT